MSYAPIENYGIIGNLNTVALVSVKGSIDFLCFPEFDSPSVFASLLDDKKGGSFSVAPVNDDISYKQLYIPDTNVLLTRFASDEGVSELTDFMPVQEEDNDGNVLIRHLSCIKGNMKFRMKFSPRFDYSRAEHSIKQISSNQVIFRSKGNDKTAIILVSLVPITVEENDAFAEFNLMQGRKADFLIQAYDEDVLLPLDISGMVSKEMHRTINFWKNWSELNNYTGRWRESVQRSALVLKLMTSKKHGSIIASPTFSLPESIGGERNWDYRYTWIRDASFTIFSLLNLGYKKEASDFMKWVEKECEDLGNAGYLSLMYTIGGENVMDEIELDFEGYRNSRPVRIGNNAKDQVQLDIYGELMDAVYLYNKYVEPISFKFWNDLARQIDWLGANWRQKDEGIWEVRGGKREFLYSRLMVWVALDRCIKIAQSRSLPLHENWIEARDKVFTSIFDDFWNDKLQAFVQFKGAEHMDAATLLMPLMRFISPRDPMWLSTMKQIEKELVSDSLVFRYRHEEAAFDGMKSGEGTFSMCTFWYIECLSRSGQLEKARLFFEKMLGYANHLGLYAEQLGFRGEHLGNFPQAFTHLGLISAAINLNKNLNDQRNREIKTNSYPDD